MRKSYIIIIFCAIVSSLYGQKKDSTGNYFVVKTKVKKDAVLLRWQPSNDLLWKVASRGGYKIERFTVPQKQDTTRKWAKKEWIIKPWTEAEWQTKMPKDTMGAVLATLAFGKELPIEEKAGLNALLQKKHENENRFFLAMHLAAYYPAQAQIMGLGLQDTDIKKGEKYLYRIYANTAQYKLKSDTASIYVDTEIVDQDPQMPQLSITEGDSIVHLKLNKQYSDKYFAGFYYERSIDGINYNRLNKRPFVQLFDNATKQKIEYIDYVDSLDQNYKKYYYKAIGITPFGEFFSTSEPIAAMGRDLKPPTLIEKLKAINLQNNQVKISWDKKTIESDFAGFIVSRSSDILGPFTPLHSKVINKSTLEFTDTQPSSYESNYYTVSSIDTSGNIAISLPVHIAIKDLAPPKMPTGLKGSMDTTGIVKITWDKNKEPDLEGYLVYTANQADHVFTPISTGFLADEFFADSTTLRTLTKNKYYKVVAFDKARKASPYSEILTIKRPDFVAPIAPIFNDYSISDSSAGITWIPSSSDDVVKQILYRKEGGKSEFQEIKTFNSTVKEFNDNNLKPGVWYSYALQAVDESGLKSEKSFPLRVKPYRTGIKPNVKQFSASIGSDKKSINISWTYTLNENQRVLIYRKINDGELQLIEGINHPYNKFIDKVKDKGKYNYAAKVKYADGSESVLSDFTKIDIF